MAAPTNSPSNSAWKCTFSFTFSDGIFFFKAPSMFRRYLRRHNRICDFFQWVLLSPEVTFKYKDIRIDRNEMDFLLSNLQSANAGPLCTRHDVVTVWMILYIFFGIFYDRFFWISSEIGDNSWSLEDRFLAFEDKSHLDPNLANDTRDWTLTTEMPRLWLEGWLLVRTQSYHFKAWFQLGNTNWSHSLHAIWVRWNSGEKKP